MSDTWGGRSITQRPTFSDKFEGTFRANGHEIERPLLQLISIDRDKFSILASA